VLLTGFGASELSRPAEWAFLRDLLARGRLPRLVGQTRQWAVAYGVADWRQPLATLLWSQLPSAVRRPVERATRRKAPPWLDPRFAERAGVSARGEASATRQFATRGAEDTYRALVSPTLAQALSQMDCAAAAFGLECRHPYLDRRVVEVALAVPAEVKLRWGYRKQFVQRALSPAGAPVRGAASRDYHRPLAEWSTARPLEEARLTECLLAADAPIFRYVDRAETKRLLRRYLDAQGPYRDLLWRFVRLDRWLRATFTPPAGT
jgi:hypothetical protein